MHVYYYAPREIIFYYKNRGYQILIFPTCSSLFDGPDEFPPNANKSQFPPVNIHRKNDGQLYKAINHKPAQENK